jgi:hypothetical protein
MQLPRLLLFRKSEKIVCYLSWDFCLVCFGLWTRTILGHMEWTLDMFNFFFIRMERALTSLLGHVEWTL